jgi:sterol desaturase/sphingolipid hydroxylase (fatty acid hydroxylase superfamily)
MRDSSYRVLAAIAVGGLGVASVGTLLWMERRFPLRRPVEPGAQRLIRNGVMAAMAGLAVQLAELPLVKPLACYCERRNIGITRVLPLPSSGASTASGALWRDLLAIILMDYTLYRWHVLMHRWDPLYRLHQVHHSDLDLDVSTATRFHFAEMLASVPWRLAQVLVIGTSPRALRIWQQATLLSILFHHSNIRLPPKLERAIGVFVTTPRLHSIHHSMVREEQNSNWSNGLTVWDFLHGTYRADRSPQEIEIGVPRYRAREQVTLGKLLTMPRVPAAQARLLLNGRAPAR